LRDDAIHTHGELISRDVAKVSTLDYLSPADRSLLEERLQPRYLRTPAATLGAPMSGRQAGYLAALGRQAAGGWSWVRASVEIDAALGRPAGATALSWLTEQGVAPTTGWDAVNAACREAAIAHGTPRPAPDAPPLAPDWDTATTLDSARREREAAVAARRAARADRARPAEPAAEPQVPAADVIHNFLDQGRQAEVAREHETAQSAAAEERRRIEESEQHRREPGRDQSPGPGIAR
jgi:hypothetical protein